MPDLPQSCRAQEADRAGRMLRWPPLQHLLFRLLLSADGVQQAEQDGEHAERTHARTSSASGADGADERRQRDLPIPMPALQDQDGLQLLRSQEDGWNEEELMQ